MKKSEVNYLIGRSYQALGKYDEAIFHFKQCLIMKENEHMKLSLYQMIITYYMRIYQNTNLTFDVFIPHCIRVMILLNVS